MTAKQLVLLAFEAMSDPSRILLAALPALLLGLAACGDAPTSPDALLVTPETQAALAVGESLPRLPAFLAAVGPAPVLARPAGAGPRAAGSTAEAGPEPAASVDQPALARASALWAAADSLSARGEDGEALRREAYEVAVPVLAAGLDTAVLHRLQRRLERWASLASSAMKRADLPDLAARLESGRSLLADARQAEAAGDRAGAVRATLLASDGLSATTPPAVAARLTADAEALLSRIQFERGERREDPAQHRIERADRLVRGAREALAARQYELAIQRAFYARELLRGGGS